MKKNTLKTSSIIILLLLLSCSKKIDGESFYLKKPSIKNEIIKFKSNLRNDQIWKVSRSKDGYIITERRNSKNKFIDKITEKITENGSELISYELSEKGIDKPITIHPKEKDIIKWNIEKTSLYTGEFILKKTIFEFKRERRFLEKKGDTIIFQDNFECLPISRTQNLFENINFSQKTYFEKNKGLVKYERMYLNGNKEIIKQE